MTQTSRSLLCSRPRKRAAVATAALVFCGFLAAPTAHADETDTFNFVAGGSIGYDSNLFRLPSSANTQAAIGRSDRSDWLYTGKAGVRVDKPYGLQRFQLDATVTDYRYRDSSYLNWTGFDYRAAWLWQITPRLGGEISASRQQVLADFADYRVYNTRNIQTIQTQRANADWWVDGGWHLLGGLVQTEARNTATFNAVGDFDQTMAEGGVRYVARDDNSVTFSLRETHGVYQGRVLDPVQVLDNKFDQHEALVRVIWRFSPESMFDGNVGYLRREHDNFAARNYSGGVGRALFSWTPRVKVTLDFSAARNLYSFQEPTNSYFVADSFTFRPKWEVSEKTAVYAKADYTLRDFRGPVVPTATLRTERLSTLSIGTEWKATRNIRVNGDLARIQRSSNYAGYDYISSSAMLSALVLF